MLRVGLPATRKREREYVCTTSGLEGRGERVIGLRWISGTHIYPSVAERDTGIGNGGGTCEHEERVREGEVTGGIDSN